MQRRHLLGLGSGSGLGLGLGLANPNPNQECSDVTASLKACGTGTAPPLAATAPVSAASASAAVAVVVASLAGAPAAAEVVAAATVLRDSSRAPTDGSCSSTLAPALAPSVGGGSGAAPSEVWPGRQLAPPEERVPGCSALCLARAGPLLLLLLAAEPASRCGVTRLGLGLR